MGSVQGKLYAKMEWKIMKGSTKIVYITVCFSVGTGLTGTS